MSNFRLTPSANTLSHQLLMQNAQKCTDFKVTLQKNCLTYCGEGLRRPDLTLVPINAVNTAVVWHGPTNVGRYCWLDLTRVWLGLNSCTGVSCSCGSANVGRAHSYAVRLLGVRWL